MIKKISKIIPLIFTFLSLILIFYIFYRTEIVFSGNKFSYYIIYYLISFLFLLFSVSLHFLKEQIRVKIILVFFSFLFSVYCVEAFLIFKIKIYEKNQKNLVKIDKATKNTKGRTKVSLYEELKKNKIKTNLYVPPVKLINYNNSILPLSSTSNVRNIGCNENGYFSIYHSDKYGFNNPDNEWNKNNLEFLTVGDSYAHGDCVNEIDTLSGQLRTFINSDSAVISFGHSGNGPLFEYATLKEYFPIEKKVKKVIWLYYEGNDLINLYNEKKNNILLNYLKNPNFSQNLKTKQYEINLMINDYFLEKYKLYGQKNETQIKTKKITLIDFFKFREFRINIFDKLFGIIDPDFSKILFLANQFVKKNNAKLYFVYIPEYFRYKNEFHMQNSSRKYVKIIKIVDSLQIPIIDLKKSISFKKSPLIYFSKNGVHFNERGYRFAADEIFKQTKN